MSRLRYCPRCAGRLVRRTFARERHPHLRCDRCGFVLWQNPKPAVGVVIVRRRHERARMVLRPLSELPADLREKLPELKGMLAESLPSSLAEFTPEVRPPMGRLPREVARRLRRRRPGQVEVLLVRRRVEPRRGAWDLPGGFLDPFEHPEEAAKREVREELGVEVDLIALLGLFVDTYGEDEATLSVHYAGAIIDGGSAPADDVDAAAWFPLNALPGDLAFQNVAAALSTLQELIEEGELAL